MLRVVGALGFLISVMALSSLIYGALTSPLEPYLLGVLGGTLEYYRAFRDLIMGGIGTALSVLINLIRSVPWFQFLPKAPWFVPPGWAFDVATIGALVIASAIRALILRVAGGTAVIFALAPDPVLDEHIDHNELEERWRQADKSLTILTYRSFFRYILTRLSGAFLFFLMAYGETRLLG
ncbi:MAG: hypothetical protein AAF850_07080 [Pseudomonadota bacterium]